MPNEQLQKLTAISNKLWGVGLQSRLWEKEEGSVTQCCDAFMCISTFVFV
jgi:hypothetical protein